MLPFQEYCTLLYFLRYDFIRLKLIINVIKLIDKKLTIETIVSLSTHILHHRLTSPVISPPHQLSFRTTLRCDNNNKLIRKFIHQCTYRKLPYVRIFDDLQINNRQGGSFRLEKDPNKSIFTNHKLM